MKSGIEQQQHCTLENSHPCSGVNVMTGNLLVARTKLLESEQSMQSYAPDEGADDTGQ